MVNLLRSAAAALVILAEVPAHAALSTTDLSQGLTPTALVNSLLGTGVNVSNVTYVGASSAAGAFIGGAGIIGFESGMVLSSGTIAHAIGPNNNSEISAVFGLPGDTALDALIPGFHTEDASVLEFDFVPTSDHITFSYVFASDEYNEFVNSEFNDVFGFFVNGVNRALLPDGVTVVSINHVNGGNPLGTNASNPQFYINNTCGDGPCANLNTQADGLTAILQLVSPVNANQVNHIKLAIADAGDGALDSWVFIRAGSLTVPSGLIITAPPNLTVVPGSMPGSLQWSPNPFTVVAFFINGTGSPTVDVDLNLDLSTAPSLSTVTPNPQHFAAVGPGQTVSATWTVLASAPGEEHYSVRALASPAGSVLAEQAAEIVVPELLVPPVTNALNPGTIHLQADGRFCTDTGMPCATPFPMPGSIGGFPIPLVFEWQKTTPLAFVPGATGAAPGLLTDHGVRSFVYAAVDSEGATGQINFYLAYDFLQSAGVPFVAGQVFSVEFDVSAGRFAGRMVVSLHCAEGTILVSGFDNGSPFIDRPADQLGIEGGCGAGTSPNPTGDPFFDVFTDADGVTQGFNTLHPIVELEVPLTRNLGGDPNPLGGVYDPSPAFWSASAPDRAGDPVLSNNMVAINVTDGSTVVTPIPVTTTTTTTTTGSTSTTSTMPLTSTTSTSTTSTVPLPTTTTTIMPPPCAPAPTFASIDCRLDALIAQVSTTADVDGVRGALLNRLNQAKARKELAEMRPGTRGRSALRHAIRSMIGFVHRVGSLTGRRRIITPTQKMLFDEGKSILDDMQTLLRTL